MGLLIPDYLFPLFQSSPPGSLVNASATTVGNSLAE
jgi:hypothetical protein